MSGDETNIDPAMFTSAGGRVAEVLERAAVPVAPPVAVAGPSPADAAAANLAALMDEHIGNASTELAPRGPNIREATQAAVAEIQAQDLRNAQQIKGISTSQAAIEQLERGLTGPGAGNRSGVQRWPVHSRPVPIRTPYPSSAFTSRRPQVGP